MPYESNLWTWLREQVKPLIAAKRLHICRVENLVLPGYPDVEGCLDGRGFHFELKGSLRPASKETRVAIKWRPGQQTWLKKRWTAGGSSFLLLRVGHNWNIKRYLIRGADVEKLGKLGALTESELRDLSIIPPNAGGLDILFQAISIRDSLLT